jgi:PPOX class probable F420-dependent enzyme
MDATLGIQNQPAHADVLPPSAATFAPFARQQTVVLTTLRRDGTPVKTPVNIAVDGDRAFIRTWDTAGKVKRIRNNPEVTIAPCTAGGRPTGPAIPARARILTGEESAHAGRLLARKHPILHALLVPLGHRLRGNTTTHIELTRSEA